ncbi:MAG: 1,4-dihydroxy-2-naphthoate octaprenyltransferase [Chloroflexota bacterium]
MIDAKKYPKLAAWYSATRPRIFTATYVPMALAAAAAIDDGVFRLGPFLLALVGTLLLQTGANLVNEYFDYRRGADELKEAGQGLTIKNKVLTPNEVWAGAATSIVLGSLIGLFLLAQSGPLLWLIGIGGVLVAVTYTAGPFPLAYNGLGEVAAGVFMGPAIVVGAYYVMDTGVYWGLVWLSVPIMLMVAAILHANNIRDLKADRAVNKRTLAVIFGRTAANHEYAFLALGSYVSLVIVVLAGLIPPLSLAAFITLPEAVRLVRIYYTSDDVPTMHMAQGRTARLHGRFGYLIAGGWLLWLVIQSLW